MPLSSVETSDDVVSHVHLIMLSRLVRTGQRTINKLTWILLPDQSTPDALLTYPCPFALTLYRPPRPGLVP